mgnify:CR=1 FL=1
MHTPPRPSFGRLVEDHGAYAALLTSEELREYLPLITPDPNHEYIAIKRYDTYDPERVARHPTRRKPYPDMIITWDKASNEIRAITNIARTDPGYIDLILRKLPTPATLQDLLETMKPTVDSPSPSGSAS